MNRVRLHVYIDMTGASSKRFRSLSTEKNQHRTPGNRANRALSHL